MKMKRQILLIIITLLSIGLVSGATLTCQQTTSASLEIPQFSSKSVEVQCTASGGSVSNIQITPMASPGTGLTLTPTQVISSSIDSSYSGTGKWSVTGDTPNDYELSFNIVASDTVAWSGASFASVSVPAAARLSVEYVLPPSIFSPTVSTLDIKITNIGGTTANNVKLQLNNNTKVDYPTTISAGASSSYSWTNLTGFNESGTYTTKVFIRDVLQDSATVTVNSASEGSNLSQSIGWNLISLSKNPSNKSVSSVLSDIIGDVNMVWGYNESAPDGNEYQWLRYNPIAFDPSSNTLQQFDIYSGYWLRMDGNATLTVTGEDFGDVSVPLTTGWTLAGFPSGSIAQVNTSIASFDDDVDIIWTYNSSAANELDKWMRYDPQAIDPDSNQFSQFIPGWGYWFNMISDVTWNMTQ